MHVAEIMTTPVIAVREGATLENVAHVMLSCHIGCVPVVGADGRIVGIITEDDFAAKKRPVPFSTLRLPSVLGHWLRDSIEQVYEEARVMRAADVMSRHVFTVRADDPVETAIGMMCEHGLRCLPVVAQQVPVGMVAIRDLLRLMVAERAPSPFPATDA